MLYLFDTLVQPIVHAHGPTPMVYRLSSIVFIGALTDISQEAPWSCERPLLPAG